MKKLILLTLLISPLAFGQSGGGGGGMQGFNQYVTSEFTNVRQEIKDVDEKEINYNERMSRELNLDKTNEEVKQELKEEKARITVLKSLE